MIRRTLSDDEARQAMEAGDFPRDITDLAETVILVLTQSWCPQWRIMKMSLDGLGDGPEDFDLAILTYEYDRSPLFQTFMEFKENTYRNWEVPYVRLYLRGELIGEGNAMHAGRIVQRFRDSIGA